MTTKQEYIDALNRMVEVYDNLDGCMSAINIFNEGVHLLEGLVNEHFEEKTETNYEHYKDEIIEGWMLDLALVDGKLKRCSRVDCDECEFNPGANKECKQRLIEWVKKPYEKPKYKLTQFEYDLLQSYSDIYSFNAFNSLSGMKEKGYFKGIGTSIPIREILDNCEVIRKEVEND